MSDKKDIKKKPLSSVVRQIKTSDCGCGCGCAPEIKKQWRGLPAFGGAGVYLPSAAPKATRGKGEGGGKNA